MKSIVIIGAGPAGLTVAFQGNRMDIGGHRFFSKDKQVMDWWEKMMPLQGADAYDDKVLHREKQLHAGVLTPKKKTGLCC